MPSSNTFGAVIAAGYSQDMLTRLAADPVSAQDRAHIDSFVHTDFAQPVFVIEGIIQASLKHLVAMIREPMHSEEAGSILCWDVRYQASVAPFRQEVLYLTKVAPFGPRAYFIESRAVKDKHEGLFLLYRSLPQPEEISVSVRWGQVFFSGYHFRVLGERRVWLRRVIAVDPNIPLPALLQRPLMKRFYAENFTWMNEAGSRSAAPYLRAMERESAYYAWLDDECDRNSAYCNFHEHTPSALEESHNLQCPKTR